MYYDIPTTTQPPIINSPPTGVIGPISFWGPSPKAKQYIEPENKRLPNDMSFPASRFLLLMVISSSGDDEDDDDEDDAAAKDKIAVAWNN